MRCPVPFGACCFSSSEQHRLGWNALTPSSIRALHGGKLYPSPKAMKKPVRKECNPARCKAWAECSSSSEEGNPAQRLLLHGGLVTFGCWPLTVPEEGQGSLTRAVSSLSCTPLGALPSWCPPVSSCLCRQSQEAVLFLQAGQPAGWCQKGPSDPHALSPFGLHLRRGGTCRPVMDSGVRSEVAKQRLLLLWRKRNENQDFLFFMKKLCEIFLPLSSLLHYQHLWLQISCSSELFLLTQKKNSVGYKWGLTAVAAVGSLWIPEEQLLACWKAYAYEVV